MRTFAILACFVLLPNTGLAALECAPGMAGAKVLEFTTTRTQFRFFKYIEKNRIVVHAKERDLEISFERTNVNPSSWVHPLTFNSPVLYFDVQTMYPDKRMSSADTGITDAPVQAVVAATRDGVYLYEVTEHGYSIHSNFAFPQPAFALESRHESHRRDDGTTTRTNEHVFAFSRDGLRVVKVRLGKLKETASYQLDQPLTTAVTVRFDEIDPHGLLTAKHGKLVALLGTGSSIKVVDVTAGERAGEFDPLEFESPVVKISQRSPKQAREPGLVGERVKFNPVIEVLLESGKTEVIELTDNGLSIDTKTLSIQQ